MKLGAWIRLICVLIILCPVLTVIHAKDNLFYMQSRRLYDPKKSILPDPYIDTLSVSQMIAIEVFVVFENKNGANYEYSLFYDGKLELPLYFGAWKNQTKVSTQKGPMDTLRQTLYLRPENSGKLEFTIKGRLKDLYGITTDQLKFNLQVNPVDSSLLPILLPDSAEASIGYTSGSTKTIFWKPASGYLNTLAQDAYAFSTKNPTTLIQSARRLYKVSSQSMKTSTFENLQDGQEYGYFAKADYLTNRGPVTIYSDLYRCIQDNTPPGTVAEPIVVPEPQGYRVSWDGVNDAVSGIEKYVIYRASDTGAESNVMVVSAQANPFYVWVDTTVQSDVQYYYRIRAVDRVGNMGDGIRSKMIDASTAFPSVPDIIFPEEEDDQNDELKYVAGTLDTLPLIHPENLDSIRVISVRDDLSFFINPPDLKMRVFDSRTIISPFPPYWVFDYAYNGSVQTTPDGIVQKQNGRFIDLNFVNGHTYYPIVIYYYRHNKTVVDSLSPRVMDCYPPEDVSNLKVQSLVSSADNGYSQWKMQLTWEKPEVDQGSPIKVYHIYRKLENESEFSPHATVQPNQTFYMDESLQHLLPIRNPKITYRVVAEDGAGNRIDVSACAWEATDRALNAPDIRYQVRSNLETLIRDTLYTHADTIVLAFENFNWSVSTKFIVSVNQINQTIKNSYDGNIAIPLDPFSLTSVIQLRAVYEGGRSSVWTQSIVAVQDSVPPSVLSVKNHPDSSYGYLYLEWNRTSLAADTYTIFRSLDGENFQKIGSVPASRDTLKWTDTDILVAYETYMYKVQPFTKTKRWGVFSNIDSDYCNRPPNIFKHAIVDRNSGKFEISVEWHRGWPIQAPNRFVTDVSIYQDYLDQPLALGIVATEPMDTTFILYDAFLRHNYIFQLRENLDNDSLNRSSGLSLPYTVSLKILEMEALTQPKKNIFLAWDHQIVDTLDVRAFHLIRSENELVQLDTLLSPNQFTFMDKDPSLEHDHHYTYRLIAVNEFHQVLAANDTTVLCDSGMVYIPTIEPLPEYFNKRSIPICWYWEQNGTIDTTTTRGADKILLQISTKSGFPVTPSGQMVEYEIQANPQVRCGNFTIPENAGNVNSQLFIRMFAQDKWGNPKPLLPSLTHMTKYDAIPPIQVDSFQVDAIRAFDTAIDSVIVYLSWDDPSLSDQNELVANVKNYRILRKWDGQESIAGVVPTINRQFKYALLDTVPNQTYSWRLISVDGAFNETTNGWIQTPVFVETPDTSNIQPLGYRSCRVQGLPKTMQDYQVEIAMFKNHFRLAHELNDEQLDFLLCRSLWMPVVEDTFQCNTGWGSHFVMDTTFFRMKARQGEFWESGWSDIKSYHLSMDKGSVINGLEYEASIPKDFVVSPNYPNPFNGGTSIQYGLPEAGYASIKIYNCTGALVKTLVDEKKSAGYHTIEWRGDNQFGQITATGIYIFEIHVVTETGVQHLTHMKMMMLK